MICVVEFAVILANHALLRKFSNLYFWVAETEQLFPCMIKIVSNLIARNKSANKTDLLCMKQILCWSLIQVNLLNALDFYNIDSWLLKCLLFYFSQILCNKILQRLLKLVLTTNFFSVQLKCVLSVHFSSFINLTWSSFFQ